jgi:ketosteroid isomerase-like protein
VSQENVEVVRRMNAAFNRRDRDALLAYYHPDVELRDLQHAPDAPECLLGIDAIPAYWAQWDAAFDDFAAEIEEYIEAGAYVLTATRWHGKGKDSGLEVDVRAVEVFEFADGKIARLTTGYSNKAEALKAVGLDEWAHPPAGP